MGMERREGPENTHGTVGGLAAGPACDPLGRGKGTASCRAGRAGAEGVPTGGPCGWCWCPWPQAAGPGLVAWCPGGAPRAVLLQTHVRVCRQKWLENRPILEQDSRPRCEVGAQTTEEVGTVPTGRGQTGMASLRQPHQVIVKCTANAPAMEAFMTPRTPLPLVCSVSCLPDPPSSGSCSVLDAPPEGGTVPRPGGELPWTLPQQTFSSSHDGHCCYGLIPGVQTASVEFLKKASFPANGNLFCSPAPGHRPCSDGPCCYRRRSPAWPVEARTAWRRPCCPQWHPHQLLLSLVDKLHVCPRILGTNLKTYRVCPSVIPVPRELLTFRPRASMMRTSMTHTRPSLDRFQDAYRRVPCWPPRTTLQPLPSMSLFCFPLSACKIPACTEMGSCGDGL
ncbi:PREDICTED: uncharacterized protein LOC102247163 [Myotis brandtii]|uniref:uncharacterized protein LOC102247163 n=1 Tax=Myotis brandtii TaxID=109478 RepID=UPI000703FD36|nr:PREDICTED: uncharacterized protein LOC102247163 [Myotis brandtii]